MCLGDYFDHLGWWWWIVRTVVVRVEDVKLVQLILVLVRVLGGYTLDLVVSVPLDLSAQVHIVVGEPHVEYQQRNGGAQDEIVHGQNVEVKVDQVHCGDQSTRNGREHSITPLLCSERMFVIE